MLFTLPVISALLSLALAAPQSSSTPICALTCTQTVAATSACGGITDITCLCKDTSFQANVYACYVSTCSSTDLAAAVAFGAQTCEANGTPINTSVIPSVGASSSAAAATSEAASSSAAPASSSAAPSASSAAASASPTTTTSSANSLKAGGLLSLVAAGAILFM